MTVKIRKHTSYTIDADGQEFEVQFEPIEGSEKITIKDNNAVVSYLSNDENVGGWYFDENDSGEFINFDPRSCGKKLELLDDESPRDAIARLKKEHPDRVFIINKYEHSMVRYYRQGDSATSATIPDQQWDVSHGCALFIAPDDCPDPAKYCDSVMEEFSDWCNGSIYGVCTAVYHKEGTDWVEGETEECWGYIGSENAKAEQVSIHASLECDL
jgi:hypothetical protein